MKKAVVLLLAALFLLSPFGGACRADSDTRPFACSVTAVMADGTVSELLKSDTQRALLTVCLLIDLGMDAEKEFLSEHFGELVLNDSYVASDGDYIMVSGYAAGKVLMIGYEPGSKTALYSVMDSELSDSMLALSLKLAAEKLTYNYKNDPSALTMVVGALAEAIGNSN